jgi:hypothetical protein
MNSTMDKYVTEDTEGFWWIIVLASDQIDDVAIGPYASEDEALADLQEPENDTY